MPIRIFVTPPLNLRRKKKSWGQPVTRNIGCGQQDIKISKSANDVVS